MPASPIEIVGEWLQNLLDPDVVNRVVAPDATYVSLNTENPELNEIMPWAGTSHGPKAFLANLTTIFARWENEAFNVTTMFASGENVAVFGDFRYPLALAGQGRELAVLDPREGRRRQGDLPAVPRGQLRDGIQLPEERLMDSPNRAGRRAVRGVTCQTTASGPSTTTMTGGSSHESRTHRGNRVRRISHPHRTARARTRGDWTRPRRSRVRGRTRGHSGRGRPLRSCRPREVAERCGCGHSHGQSG